MKVLWLAVLTVLCLGSFRAASQTTALIGASQEFILENVRGYPLVEERGLEHEEFDVLVFEDKEKNRELSFFFTFYRGEKVCNFIKNKAPLADLTEELDFIKTRFHNSKGNIWENQSKTIEVQLTESGGYATIIAKAIRN